MSEEGFLYMPTSTLLQRPAFLKTNFWCTLFRLQERWQLCRSPLVCMGRLIPTESTSIAEVPSVLLSRSVNKKLRPLAEDLSISQGRDPTQYVNIFCPGKPKLGRT